MSPRFIIAGVCLFVCVLPNAQAQLNDDLDSASILKQDSTAYKLFLSRPDSAIRIAKNALENSMEIRNWYLEGFSDYVLSKSYWAKGNLKLAADYGFRALKQFENSRELRLWSKSLLSLARTFIDLHNFEQGDIYIQQAIALSEKHHDPYILAEAYREMSMLFSERKLYDSAIYYADEGLKIFSVFKDSISESILFSRKAKIYFNEGKYSLSSYYNRRALLYDSLVGNRRALGVSYYQSAQDAFHQHKLDSAIFLLSRSISINKEMHNLASLIKAHNLLANVYIEQGKPSLAASALNLVSQYKDSLYNTEKTGQIQEMQALHELASKQQRIDFLEQENKLKQQQVIVQRLFVAVLLVGILLLGATIFFQRRYRLLQERSNAELASKNRSIEQQKEEIQSQAETLQELNLLKSKLFSVISHDLRGPMATLHAILDLLIHKHMTAEEFLTIAEKLKGSMDITQRTLENLLNWSLSQMEGMKTDRKTIDLSFTISEACKLMLEAAERKNVNIQHTLPGSLFVTADEDQILLILRNLIHNAIKFSKPYDQVHVSAKCETDFCYVTVRDTGIGMTKTEVDMVVSSKQYFSKTGTMQEKGTGLGLLLCHEFIKLNGGEIKIKSNINSGTEVVFTLPIASIYLN